MGAPYMAYHIGEVPAGSVESGLPGMVLSLEELRVLYQHVGWKEVLRKAYAEHNAYWIGEYSTPASYVVTKKPIKSLDDFKGLKLRAVGANAKFLRNLGGVAVSVSFGEVYTGLATGIFDGVVGSALMDLSDGKFYELVKYVYPLPVSGSINVPIIINMDEWKKLPDDLKFILELAVTKFNFDHRSILMVELSEKMKVMKAAGLKWSPDPSQADKAKWIEAGRKTWSEYEKDKYSKQLLKVQSDFFEMIAK
jgi:TRAP-type C4-dicarboxylate transport system substrate-binding protein